ncbi:MFS transporter [Chromobacterium alticapitis]|uniref:MFS transporter n=1 Tax=Chromobacterium alticapitis TaxID=2073169 RepID=A0A2S5DJG8_9NEIS|nr:MFS transporter [Chromobacterium alticapitis]POZ63118.1 MFS transporter [Chromobacterium alticapitis]
MEKPSRDILVLALGQALTSTVVSLLTSVSSLSGAYLAPERSLSTLPVTATVLGALLMIYPASMLMGRMGRRSGFMFKAGIGVLGGLVCGLGLWAQSFATLILGAFLLGIFSSFGQYYRFAAIDAARTPAERTSAVSIVTGAGVVGGVTGPFLGGHFAGALAGVPYAGAFAALAAVCVLLALSQMWLSTGLGKHADAPGAPARLDLRSDFAKASALCAIGFAVMTLVMNATPISLQMCGFGVQMSAQVLQVHFALMYLPSLFNPTLVRWFGLRGLVAAGIAISAAGCLMTLLPAQSYAVYMAELALSGIGWNFIFNGGTLLLANTYPASLRVKAQGINSLVVYSANVLASFGAGAFMAFYGWQVVNAVCLPLLAVAALVLRSGQEAARKAYSGGA